MPKISVILPIYNAQVFIADAVKSVLTQSVQDFELILIDDASSDRTPEILAGMADPRIHVVRHDENRGLVASLNEGLRLSCGKYVARMDHDDIAMPDRFARQLSFLELNHSIGVVGTGYRLIDGEGTLGPSYRPPVTHEEISWAMSFLCPLAHPTVIARRELLIAQGGYSDSASYAEDYDLWERLSRQVKFANLPEPLLLLRKHGNNMTNVWLDKNIAVATDVASRRIGFLLGEEVDRDVVHCLYTQGHVHQERIGQSLKLIMRLMQACSTRYPSVERIIRRDAAIRIALMGLRTHRPGPALSGLLQATKLNPSFATALLKKLKRRLLKQGDIQLIG
jgi:cellulose synthase/poly-beta-1,6-N-acetylglucosamine synthase-like glycosyltransferase